MFNVYVVDFVLSTEASGIGDTQIVHFLFFLPNLWAQRQVYQGVHRVQGRCQSPKQVIYSNLFTLIFYRYMVTHFIAEDAEIY